MTQNTRRRLRAIQWHYMTDEWFFGSDDERHFGWQRLYGWYRP